MGGRIGGKHVTRSGTQITLGGVGPDLSFSTFSSITFIIRTVIRGLGVGGSILGRIRAGIDRSAVVTAGASSLSVTSLTRSLSHPRGFINVRFFGPIPVVPLMRVVHKPGDDSRTVTATIGCTTAVHGAPIIIGSYTNFLIGHVLATRSFNFVGLVHSNTSFRRISGIVRTFN